VVVPAYNEERRIGSTLTGLLTYLAALPPPVELVVVDDGSSDDTDGVARRIGAGAPSGVRFSVINLRPNQGKGAAVRAGCLAAAGDRVLFTDADLATPIAEAAKLWEALDAGYDVAIGTRVHPDGRDMRASQPAHRRILGALYHRLRSLLLLPGVRDTQCGFKAFTRPAAQFLFARQQLTGIVFDAEILFVAQQAGMRIAQVPVVWSNVGGSRMRVTARHAWRVLADLVTIRARHRDPAAAAWLAAVTGSEPRGGAPLEERPAG
jgi:dolichyl-phosphate beta-glucosyltransferase